MNEEEKNAFSGNSLTKQQVTRLKLRLQQDDFFCAGSFSQVQYDEMDTRVVLEESFVKI